MGAVPPHCSYDSEWMLTRSDDFIRGFPPLSSALLSPATIWRRTCLLALHHTCKYCESFPVPVIPATWEAEAGELSEPRRRRLWWAEMAPLHSSLGNKSKTPSQKKKKKISALNLGLGSPDITFYSILGLNLINVFCTHILLMCNV